MAKKQETEQAPEEKQPSRAEEQPQETPAEPGATSKASASTVDATAEASKQTSAAPGSPAKAGPIREATILKKKQEAESVGPEEDKERLIREEQERLERIVHERMVEKAGPTDRLDEESRQDIPNAIRTAFGLNVGGPSDYIVLPTKLQDAERENLPRWRVQLHGLAPGKEPVGIEIIGDVVLGRGKKSEPSPDLDLDEYGALDKGVSRRHALIRPTRNRLFIIDLNSTNGTTHNMIPIGPGIARALANNDTVTLGNLTFTIKIVEQPGPGEDGKTTPVDAHGSDEHEEKTKPLAEDDMSTSR